MGCNCKKTHKVFSKLADNAGEEEYIGTDGRSVVDRIVQIVIQAVFGLIVGCILVVCIVPMMLYIIGCLVLGKEPSFRIINFRKRFNSDDRIHIQDKNAG